MVSNTRPIKNLECFHHTVKSNWLEEMTTVVSDVVTGVNIGILASSSKYSKSLCNCKTCNTIIIGIRKTIASFQGKPLERV